MKIKVEKQPKTKQKKNKFHTQKMSYSIDVGAVLRYADWMHFSSSSILPIQRRYLVFTYLP